MEELINQLLTLYNYYIISGNNNEKIQEISNEISLFYNDSKNIIPILLTISKTNDQKIRLLGYTSLISIVRKQKSNFDEETIEFLDSIFQNLIIEESINNNRVILIEQISLIYSLNNKIEKFENLIKIAENLLENSEYLSTSLTIWNSIISNATHLIESRLSFINEILLPIISSSYSAEKKEIRISTYPLFSKLYSILEGNISNNLLESFSNELIHSTEMFFSTNSDSNEASLFFKSFCEIIEICTPFVEEYCFPIFELVSNNCLNNLIDIMIRFSSLSIFSQIMKFSPFILNDQLSIFLNNLILFSIEICKENPEEKSYYVGFEFFKESALYIEEENDSIEFFLPILNELFSNNDPITFQISFMLLTSILDASEIHIMELYDDFEPIIALSFESENIPLIEELCSFLQQLVKSAQSLASQIQEKFENYFLNYVENDRVLDCLASIYEVSQQEPIDSSKTLQILLDQFQSQRPEHHEAIIQVINAVIRTVDEIDESVYITIKPYLEALLQVSFTAKGKALSCFSAFSITTPKLILNDLQLFVPEILNSISLTNFQLSSDSLLTAQNLFGCFRISLLEFHQPFFEKCLEIINLFKEDEDGHLDITQYSNNNFDSFNEEEEEAEYMRIEAEFTTMIGSAFEFLGSLFSLYPESLKDYSDTILKLLIQFIEKENPSFSEQIFNASQDVIDGCNKLNISVISLIDSLINESVATDNFQILLPLWYSLGYICRICDKNTLKEISNSLMDKVITIISGKLSYYNQSLKIKRINKEMIRPMLDLIEEFIINLGEDSKPFINDLIPLLLNIYKEKSPIIKSSVLMTLSVIVNVFPDLTNLYSTILTNSESIIHSNIAEVKSPIFLALNYLIEVNPNPLSSMAIDLYNITTKIIQDQQSSNKLIDSSIILWGSLVQIYNIEPNLEILELVLKQMPFVMNNYMLRFSAHFSIYCLNKWSNIINQYILKIIVNILGSDDKTQKAIISEDLDNLIQIAINSNEEIIYNLCRYNENTIYYFKKNL